MLATEPRDPPGTSRLILAPLGLLLVAHLCLVGFFHLSSVDTWFHLKQGQLYVATGSLPPEDPFAFTTAGRAWLKYSWLADVLFYLIYAGAGVPGLILFRLGCLLLASFLLYRLLRGCGVAPPAAILLVFLASLGLRFRLFVRPELLTFLLLLATLLILFQVGQGSPRWAYALIPIVVVWVNVHGSYLFGIGLPALVVLANLLPGAHASPAWGRLRLGPPALRHLTLAVAALPAAALLNPHGYALLLFPFRQNLMVRLTVFPEWMEAWKLPSFDPAWWEPVIVLLLLVAGVVSASVLLLLCERRYDPVGLAILLTLGPYVAFRNRAIPYFLLAILPFLAVALVRLFDHAASSASPGQLARARRLSVVAGFALLALAIVDQALLTPRFPPGIGVSPNIAPEGAAAFLDRHGLDGRVFNSYRFGSYLLWRRWPANRVFIDGRYDAILFDERLLEDYHQAHVSAAALERLAATHGFDLLVLDARPGSRPIHLDGNPTWARVYWDPVAEVYARRNGRHAGLIARHEYRLTRAFMDPAALAAYRADPAMAARALAELERAAREAPGNALAWAGLLQESRAAGTAALRPRLEALDGLLTILPAGPAAARLHAERADVLVQLGQAAAAAEAARTARRLDPGISLSPRLAPGRRSGTNGDP